MCATVQVVVMLVRSEEFDMMQVSPKQLLCHKLRPRSAELPPPERSGVIPAVNVLQLANEHRPSFTCAHALLSLYGSCRHLPGHAWLHPFHMYRIARQAHLPYPRHNSWQFYKIMELEDIDLLLIVLIYVHPDGTKERAGSSTATERSWSKSGSCRQRKPVVFQQQQAIQCPTCVSIVGPYRVSPIT
jgi:hypothetical protein